MGRGGGGFLGGGGIRKFSSLKVEGGRGFFTGKCTDLMGHSRENWRGGGSCKIFQG